MTTKFKPINTFHNDFYTDQGVRISMPLYVDAPSAMRKNLFNAIRDQQDQTSVTETLGMEISVLRTLLFQRGGIPLDLMLRMQTITGIDCLDESSIRDAFSHRLETVLDYKAAGV